MKQFTQIFSILCFFTVGAQPDILLQKTIGGHTADALQSAMTLPSGDIILIGNSESNISGEKSENSRGYQDFWVLRISPSHEIIWQKTIGGSLVDVPSTGVLSEDSILLAGNSSSNISGEKSEDSRGSGDYWLVKLDFDGNILWQKTIGGSCADILMSLSKTLDGGHIVGGMSCSGISGEKTETARGGSYDYWILKLNASGEIEWQKTFGGSNIEYLRKVKQVADGGFVVVGNSSSNADFDKTEACRGDYDFWILRLDSQGNIVWQKTIGGSAQDIPEDVVELENGTLVIGGWSESDISGEKTENSRGSSDFWLVHLDASGTIINQKTIGGNSFDQLLKMTRTADNGFLVAGLSYSPISGEKTTNNCGNSDAWILKLDEGFQVVWQKTLGGENSDGISDLEITDSNILLGGNSRSDISCEKSENSRGGNDFWVVKMEPEELGVPQIDFKQISIAPNPTEGNVDVTFDIPFSGTLELTDQTGKILKSMRFKDKSELSIFISQPSGIYFLKIKNGSKSSVFKIIKK